MRFKVAIAEHCRATAAVCRRRAIWAAPDQRGRWARALACSRPVAWAWCRGRLVAANRWACIGGGSDRPSTATVTVVSAAHVVPGASEVGCCRANCEVARWQHGAAYITSGLHRLRAVPCTALRRVWKARGGCFCEPRETAHRRASGPRDAVSRHFDLRHMPARAARPSWALPCAAQVRLSSRAAPCSREASGVYECQLGRRAIGSAFSAEVSASATRAGLGARGVTLGRLCDMRPMHVATAPYDFNPCSPRHSFN